VPSRSRKALPGVCSNGCCAQSTRCIFGRQCEELDRVRRWPTGGRREPDACRCIRQRSLFATTGPGSSMRPSANRVPIMWSPRWLRVLKARLPVRRSRRRYLRHSLSGRSRNLTHWPRGPIQRFSTSGTSKSKGTAICPNSSSRHPSPLKVLTLSKG
jgi:hypothetical protein